MKKIFVKSLAVLLVCMFAISGFNFSILASETTNLGDKIAAMNIAISGKISLMFYFKDLGDVDHFNVTVGTNDTTTVDKDKLTVDSQGRYLLTVKLAAAQQADLVAVQGVKADGTKGHLHTYSITEYAEKLFALANANADYARAAEAVKAMLNYGAMAQTYFNYNNSAATLANNGLYYRDTNPVSDMDYEDLIGITPTDSVTGIISSVEAFLEDTVSLRFYLDYSGDVNDLTVSIENKTYPDQILTDESGRHYILINNIPATLFNKQYKVSVSDGSSSHTVSYSVLNYLQAKLAVSAAQSDKKFMDTAYAAYLFYVWANEYVKEGEIITSDRIGACLHSRTYIDNVVDKDQDGTLDRHIFCSDCGELRGAAGWFEVSGTTVSAHSGSLDSNGNLVNTDISYTANGFNGYDSDKGLLIPAGKTMTLENFSIPSLDSHNRFFLDYCATQPVEVHVTYTDSILTDTKTTTNKYTRANMFTSNWTLVSTSTSNNQNTTGTSKTDSFYLEAGDSIFSAVYEALLSNFFADKSSAPETSETDATFKTEKTETIVEKAYTYLNTTEISSIVVTPLTSEDTYFVMFNYETSTVSLDDVTTVSYTNDKGNGTGDSISAQMSYIQKDGAYKLGVSLSWGGTIAALYDLDASAATSSGNISSGTNLVNNFDTGRLIQQSYYGTFGDSGDGYVPRYYNVTGTPSRWNYNPVQAGDMSQNAARVIDYEKGTDYYGNPYIYIKILPRDWACQDSSGNEYNDGGRYTKCYLENRYTITDDYVKVDNRLVDFSPYKHHVTHQELPAFYTLSEFDDFYWYNGTSPWTDANWTPEDNLPFWGYQEYVDDTTFTFQMSNTETWGAWIDETSEYGIGLYIPNVDQIKGGQSETKGASVTPQTTNSASTYTSYFMAAKSLKIIPFVPVEYSYLICAGNVSAIRSTFKANKDFASNYSLNDNSVSLRMPDNEIDMTSIDFTLEENLPYIQRSNQIFTSYSDEQKAAKLLVDGGDPYFFIDYTMFNGSYSGNHSCIEFEYMIESNSAISVAGGIYYKMVNGTMTYQAISLVADGGYHTAKIYTDQLSGWSTSDNIEYIRLDFIEAGIAGQVMYIKSFKLTDRVYVSPYEDDIKSLNVGYCGTVLLSQINGIWKNDINAFLQSEGDDEFVRVQAGTGGDKYFTLEPGGTQTTGKYMVVRYRTSAIPTSGSFNLFATSGTNGIEGTSSFNTYNLVGDGKWHLWVVDLTASQDVSGTNINRVRFDFLDSFPTSSIVDIAYIGFCENPATQITCGEGEYIEYSSDRWILFADSIDVAGSNKASASQIYYSHGANHIIVAPSDPNSEIISSVFSGLSWSIGGWFGVADQDITKVEYFIVDQSGTAHPTEITLNGTGSNRWFKGNEDVQNAVKTAFSSNSCTGYNLYANIDLSEYAGQTINLSIRAITSGGQAVTLYAAEIIAMPYVDIDPYYNMNLDSFLYATQDNYSDVATISGEQANWNGESVTMPVSLQEPITAKHLAMLIFDTGAPGGWIGVNGYPISSMEYRIYDSTHNEVLMSGSCLLSENAAITTELITKLQYVDGTVGYNVTVPVINLTALAGKTVTFELWVTLGGVNTDPVIPLTVTINVPAA